MGRSAHPPILREMQALRKEGLARLILQALVVGAGSGAVVGAFRACCVWTNTQILDRLNLSDLYAWPVICAVFSGLLLLALAAGYMLIREPLSGGSGIPQVELAIAGRSSMVWRSVLAHKFLATWISLAGWLSVGREGPCIQMGAAAACGLGQLWHKNAQRMPRYLIAGSVGGLTAAFGAPLGGMLFAFEEMKAIITVPLLLFTAVAAGAAWFVVSHVFGFGQVFPFGDIVALRWEQLWIAALLGIGAGLLGAGYNAALLGAVGVYDRQKLLPTLLRPVLPFLCAGALFYVYPQVLEGIGPTPTQLPRMDMALQALLLLFTVKVAFSILSFSSGVAGGLLMPILLMGSLGGIVAAHLCSAANIISPQQTAALLAVCMSGFFAGSVRAPLTGAALVTEMCGAWNCLPEVLAAAALGAFTASRLGSLPVYDSLRARALRHEAQRQGTAPAGPPRPADAPAADAHSGGAASPARGRISPERAAPAAEGGAGGKSGRRKKRHAQK